MIDNWLLMMMMMMTVKMLKTIIVIIEIDLWFVDVKKDEREAAYVWINIFLKIIKFPVS